jgi:hypothetical protein
MIATEHTYFEGTTFSHELPEVITDTQGEILPDGEYLAKVWFADGEVTEYQLAENILIINGQIMGDEEPCAIQGDTNGDQNLNVLDVVLTVNNVLCLDGGVLVIDFIDMESRRDQFQLLEHFTLAIKDDSARPQIAQLTELGLVELTRKRQGQNIYELLGTKCSNCNGLGHIENLPNYKNNSLKTNQNAKKSSKINEIKIPELAPIQLIENQETIIREDLTNNRNTNKDDDHSNKRGSSSLLVFLVLVKSSLMIVS